jgi:uncharacterized protein YecE (DUF72 family)
MNKSGGLTNGKENDQMKHMYKNSLPTSARRSPDKIRFSCKVNKFITTITTKTKILHNKI